MYSGKKVAVIGGTGKIGTYVLRHLLLAGYEVKLLTRNKFNLSVFSDKIEIVEGNASDYLSVLQLVEGCSAVINSISSENRNEPIHSTATKNILKAIKNFDIKRYININGISIDVPGDKKSFKNKVLCKILHALFPQVINDKQLEFKLIESSDTEWTVIRCPQIEIAEKKINLNISNRDCLGKNIDPNSLAEFVISILNNKQYVRKAPFVWN